MKVYQVEVVGYGAEGDLIVAAVGPEDASAVAEEWCATHRIPSSFAGSYQAWSQSVIELEDVTTTGKSRVLYNGVHFPELSSED